MTGSVICDYSLDLNKKYEVIERKGFGHPDTLADELGERLSVAYSKYCIENFGVVLHHNFDKVGMMGGMSNVGFKVGEILEPIRVLINGRASSAFGSTIIPLRELLEEEIRLFFSEMFPHINNVEKIYKIMWEVASGSSPGAVADEDSYRQHWFMPRDKSDLSELVHLNCNDTSMGMAFYGNTVAEKFVLEVESTLNSKEFKLNKPWLGNDIKIMCCRIENEISLTLCVPQIGIFVNNITEYKNNIEVIKEEINRIFNVLYEGTDCALSININMRDRYGAAEKDLYITYTGSSVEMGDEGFVGRGNRYGGLITPNRFYSMEGIAGKNPIYHTGKMYSVFAYELSKKIYEEFGTRSESIFIGMTGHPLVDPHRVIINLEKNNVGEKEIMRLVDSINPSEVTTNILDRKYRMF